MLVESTLEINDLGHNSSCSLQKEGLKEDTDDEELKVKPVTTV